MIVMCSERIENNSELLKRIADKFPANSPERQALKHSALAYAYVVLICEREFDEYVNGLWKPLVPDEPVDPDSR